jgi:D-lactate dehydrogenase (cytochrome)
MSATRVTASALAEFLEAARRIVGSANVLDSEHDRKLHSTDFSEMELAIAAAVVRPRSTEDVVAVVEAAHRAGVPIVARGGGMSYSLTYVPAHPGIVMLDMSHLNRILELNVADLRVTVETGVTWKQLHAALAPTGYRVPFLGTFSGEKATIGGGLGNNATGHGALDIGDYLLGMEVVLPDGRLLQTGARAHAPEEPIVRGYGPDLTGLFTHDAGAFGIKTKASFRLVRRPRGTAYRCYGFRDGRTLIDAMCAVTRLGIATDMTSFESYHHQVFANQPRPPADEARAFARAVMAGASSRVRGLLQLATLARGMRFLLKWPHSVTIVVENWSQSAADAGAREIDRTMKRFGATRIRASLGIALRAQPFVPIGTLMVGLDGASSFPSNFTVPLSRAHELADEARTFFAENAAEMERHGIYVTTLQLCLKGAFGMEPIIYWPDRLNVLRYETALPSLREKFGGQPARPEARACAIDLRKRLIARLERLHPAHYQVGKFYAYREAVAGHAGWSLVEGFKRHVDPQGRVNPGALGL